MFGAAMTERQKLFQHDCDLRAIGRPQGKGAADGAQQAALFRGSARQPAVGVGVSPATDILLPGPDIRRVYEEIGNSLSSLLVGIDERMPSLEAASNSSSLARRPRSWI